MLIATDDLAVVPQAPEKPALDKRAVSVRARSVSRLGRQTAPVIRRADIRQILRRRDISGMTRRHGVELMDLTGFQEVPASYRTSFHQTGL